MTEMNGVLGAVFDSAAQALRVTGNIRSMDERYKAPTGAYQTLPRLGISNQALPDGTSGTVNLTALVLPKGLTVTTLNFFSATTAAVAPTNWWMALCNSSYVTLRSTADQLTAAVAANAKKSIALSSTFTTTYEGLHYLAFLMAAGTVCTALGGTCGASALAKSDLPYVALTGLTGQTVPVADGTNLAPSPTISATPFYATAT